MNTNNEKLAAEKISAYIDDALHTDEVEALLHEDKTSKQTFSAAARYHMMGDALRGELSDASMVDVSAQIHQALRDESFDAVEAKPAVKKPSSSKNRFDLFAWLDSFARPLTGMAVAASVAVLMVVTVVQMQSPENSQQVATNAPVNLPAVTLVANKKLTVDQLSKEQQAAEFDVYLTEHAKFAGQDTLQGRIPYVRAVSYEVDQ